MAKIPGIVVDKLLPITKKFNPESFNRKTTYGLLACCEMLWKAKELLGDSMEFTIKARQKSPNSLAKKQKRKLGEEIKDEFACSLIAGNITNPEKLKVLDDEKVNKLVDERNEKVKLLLAELYFFRRQLALDHSRFKSEVSYSEKLIYQNTSTLKQNYTDSVQFVKSFYNNATVEMSSKDEINTRFKKLIDKEINEIQIVLDSLDKKSTRREIFSERLSSLKEVEKKLKFETKTKQCSNHENYFKHMLLLLDSYLDSIDMLPIKIKQGKPCSQDDFFNFAEDGDENFLEFQDKVEDFSEISEKDKIRIKHLYREYTIPNYRRYSGKYDRMLTDYIRRKKRGDFDTDVSIDGLKEFSDTLSNYIFTFDDKLKQEALRVLATKYKKTGNLLSGLNTENYDKYVKENGYVATHYELNLPESGIIEVKFMTDGAEKTANSGSAAHAGYVPDPNNPDEKALPTQLLPRIRKPNKPENPTFDVNRKYKVHGYYLGKLQQWISREKFRKNCLCAAYFEKYGSAKDFKKRPHEYSIWHEEISRELPMFFKIFLNKNDEQVIIEKLSEQNCAYDFFSGTNGREEGQKALDGLEAIDIYNLLDYKNINYTLSQQELYNILNLLNQRDVNETTSINTISH